jgi:uncharacterized protein YgiM (DUF1202 family)
MKKISVMILLPLCLLACATVDRSPSRNSIAAPPANEVETLSVSPSNKSLVTVTWTFANIRAGVGNDYPIVKFVKQGDKLRVIGASGDWFNICLEDGQEGWISSRVVK